MKKVIGGYNVQIENLNKNNINTIMDLSRKQLLEGFSDTTSVSINLYCGELTQIDYYWLTLSEGFEGLKNKLNEWLENKDYYTKELDYDEKEEFISKEIKKYVHEDSNEWLEEQFSDLAENYDSVEDFEENCDNYYSDCSLDEIVGFIYDVFAYDETKYAIEVKMKGLLGYYSDMYLTKVDDMHYLFLD